MWNYTIILLLSFLLNTSNRILLASDLDESASESAENEIYYEISLASKNLSDIHLAASTLISQYIDEDANPCDDFYKFACGNFANVSQKIRSDSNDIKVHQKVINGQLKKLLMSSLDEVKLKHESEWHPDSMTAFIAAQRFFLSCKNKKSAETAGIQPLLKLIETYGGWPLVKGDQWDENNWDLMETIAQMTRDGLNTKALFSFHTESHELEQGRYTLTITEPEFGIGRFSLSKNYKPYFDFMVNVAVQFGADESSARIQMAQVLHFERQLAKNTRHTNYMGFKEQQRMITIQELQISYPYLDWLKYIQSVLPSDVKVDQNESLHFDFSYHFAALENLLKQTRKRTIANYLIWRAVIFSTEYLNEHLYSERMKMLTEVKDYRSFIQQGNSARYHNCFDKTSENMVVAINIIFNQLRKPKITATTDALVDSIKSEFIEMIQEVRWMKMETKKSAIKKAENMTIVVALNSTNYKNAIKNYYDGLNLRSENYFENVLSLLRFEEVKKHQKLHQSLNEADILMYESATEVNAFYLPAFLSLGNIVNLNTAILDYFVADLPNYLNYGAFGYIVGHEITHAFDTNGHVVGIGWSHDKNEFDRRAECFKEQYTRLGTDGKRTVGENIADNGGVKAAYRAYKKYVDRHGPEALLPNLKYTTDQLFWIASAQPWCSTATENTAEDRWMDFHSPPVQRVNGMVQNMDEFARDFECSPRSEMNPKNRCKIW